MAAPLPYDAIVKRIGMHVRDLESLAHTKNRDKAIKLLGHIEEAVLIAGIGINEWQKRMQRAKNLVMAEREDPAPVSTELLDGLGSCEDACASAAI